ncbi:MAG: DUF3795 domain-containing protein [Thermoplasmata archaeon]
MKENMGACGLLCSECCIFRANADKKAARELLDCMIKIHAAHPTTTIDEFMRRGPFCEGCHGKRWSPDCWILECCTDDKHLDDCSGCEYFPCDRLIEWSKDCEEYSEALERLQSLNRTPKMK